MLHPYYVYDPENGYQFFELEHEAQDYAEKRLSYYWDRAPDGWHDDIDSLEFGSLRPFDILPPAHAVFAGDFIYVRNEEVFETFSTIPDAVACANELGSAEIGILNALCRAMQTNVEVNDQILAEGFDYRCDYVLGAVF